MPSPFRTPTPALRAATPLLVLLRAALLAVIGLCALVHGLSGGEGRETHGVTATSYPASVAGGAVPHGPHRHHGDEECALDAAVLATAQAAQHAPAEVGTAVLVGVSVAPMRPAAGRAPCRRRGRRTGKAALVRTSRWRI
ncbi:hypothetical protein SAMN06272735_7848 [Streptomyces sp. TLI_55]|uniref:hypothetical protein n=1 Tax=Streptomyces sp. TLI_55 TaxID=1938861 RepID=UPI000BC68540|nr:hypothetical protein [Streptomyces sp. TLI_55]SNX66005.1 hypothetical protein SAMN06272735_7848 [Streptomyces sp. TLI_55]